MRANLAVSTLALTGCLVAQQTTSPRGYLAKAGDNSSPSVGMARDARGAYSFQLLQLDDTQRGRAQTIRAIHLRRSSIQSVRKSSTSRMLKVMLRIGHGDYSKITATPQSVDSLLVGSWSNVFQGTIQFPDMTKPAASTPAAWSVRIPFSTPFSYDGKAGLYFQLAVWEDNPTSEYGYSLDGIDETQAWTVGGPVGAGKGCKHNGQEVHAEAFFNVAAATSPAPSMLFLMSFPQVTPTPFQTIAMIGVNKVDVPVPGVCAPLLVDPIVTMPMFSRVWKPEESLAGWFNFVPIMHSTSYIGLELIVQTWSPDATQSPVPFAGSTAWRTGRYPAQPVPTTKVALAQMFVSAQNFGKFETQAGLTQSAGLIVGLEQ